MSQPISAPLATTTTSLANGTHNPSTRKTKPITRTWWKEASIYQIYPASFSSHAGSTMPHGTIKGITSRLPYISQLGVDAIWLCPIYASPQKDMGYDISDYRAIHAPYGNMDDVRDLIHKAHDAGLKVVMDLVVNHSSDQHAWFKESRSNKTNAKRDWYIWRPAKYVTDPKTGEQQRKPPNNWMSMFGGSAWSWDETTQEYYLALFCQEQPDLNWENDLVVKEVHDVMHFWLGEMGIDGFRMDVINLISKEPGLPDGDVIWPDKEFQPGDKWFAYGPRLNEYLRGLRQVLDKYDAFAVGEMPCVNKDEQVAAVVAEESKQLNMIFQFDIVDMDIGGHGKFSEKKWDANTLKGLINRWQTFMYECGGWNALFLENHDQARSPSRFTPHRPAHLHLAAKLLATLLACQAGTLYVYQGQELGMTNLPESWDISEYKDVETLNIYAAAKAEFGDDEKRWKAFETEMRKKARDHARSPVQWTSSSPHAGFLPEDAGVEPWMRVNTNHTEINAAQQDTDRQSVLNYWRKLLSIRKDYKDILVYGSFEMVNDGSEKVIAYKRQSEKGTVWVLLNFVDEDVRWRAPEEVRAALKGGREVVGTYGEDGRAVVMEGEEVMLRPFEGRVVVVEG